MQQEVKEICLSFIEKYIPSCKAAMITGSASVSDMNENSDIDILILDDNISRDYFESIHYEGYEFDCIVLPSILVGDILNQEYNNGMICYIGMLSKGMIIRDYIEILAQLQKYAISLENSGPKQIDIHNKKNALFRAHGLYNDLEAEREWHESLFIAMDLFNSLIYLNSTLHTYWSSAGKWKYRYLNKFDSNFTESITESFTKLVAEKNKSDFLHLSKKNLLSFGEKPKQFSSRYYSFVITNNLLTISVNSRSSINVVYENYIKKLNDKLELFESSITMFYVYNDSSILDESNYLIFIKGENEILNHIITPIINAFIIDQKEVLVANSIISSLNYQFEPESLFEHQQVYELMKPVLVYFNKFHEWIGGHKENKIMTYLTHFHLSLGSKLGFSVERYIDFNKYLLKRWIPFVIDADKKGSFNILEQKRTAKLNHYQLIFDNQKASLIDNFSVVYDDWGTTKNENLEDYLSEGVSLLSSFYHKMDQDFFLEHFVPQFKLNQIDYNLSDLEKKRWMFLATAMNVLYSSVLLTADQKLYLSFANTNLLELLQNKIIVHNEE